MTYTITNQNLVVVLGGGQTGTQRHYPIFLDQDGVECISLNGQTLQPISNLKFQNSRREFVERG